jgi:hypothetical protein
MVAPLLQPSSRTVTHHDTTRCALEASGHAFNRTLLTQRYRLHTNHACRWLAVRASFKRFQRDSVRDGPRVLCSNLVSTLTPHLRRAFLIVQYENGLLVLGLRDRTETGGVEERAETSAASSTLALAFRCVPQIALTPWLCHFIHHISRIA